MLYDDFNSDLIDPNRWLGLDTDSTSEQIRAIEGNTLHLATRVYSHPSPTSFRASRSAVRFVDPQAVRAMAAEMRVMEVQFDSCSPTGVFARSSANISGSFFKSGGALLAGDRTNDVRAGIIMYRDSRFTTPEGELRVTAFINKCNDATCSSQTTLDDVVLDTSLSLKSKVPVGVEWDEPGLQFVFTYGDIPPVPMSYAALAPPPYTARRR